MLDGPLIGIIEAFAKILGSTTGLYATLGLIGTYMSAKFITSIIKAGKMMGILKAKTVATAVAKAWNAAMSAGPLSFFGGLALGAVMTVAILAAVAAAGRKKDDFMLGSLGSNGYGKRMLSAPEGTFALNNKDTIIAGTDLFKSDDTINAPAGAITAGGGGEQMAVLKEIAKFTKQSRNVNATVVHDEFGARSKLATGGTFNTSIKNETKFI